MLTICLNAITLLPNVLGLANYISELFKLSSKHFSHSDTIIRQMATSCILLLTIIEDDMQANAF